MNFGVWILSRDVRSSKRMSRGFLHILLLAPLISGCATLVGLPLSPVTGAVGGVVHSRSDGWDRAWGYPLGFAAGAAFGPLLSISTGWSADAGRLEHGEYGVAGAPAFSDVFDPYGYCLEPREAGTTHPKSERQTD